VYDFDGGCDLIQCLIDIIVFLKAGRPTLLGQETLQVANSKGKQKIVCVVDSVRSQKLYNVGMLQATQQGKDVLLLLEILLGIDLSLYLLSNDLDL